MKDLNSKCNQIRSFKRTWSHLHLLKKSLMENFIFLCSEFAKMVKSHLITVW